MLDMRIQERLKPSLSRERRNFLSPMAVSLAVTLLLALIGSYTYIVNAESIDDHQLGKLAVLAAESLEESPAGIWVLMENYIGKPQENFNAEDSLRAAKYLVNRIDVSAMKREKESSVRLDL